MSKREYLVLICCSWIAWSSYFVPLQGSVGRQSNFFGNTERVEGSPVAVSDARYEMAKSEVANSKLAEHRFKVENVSGRAIRQVFLSLDWRLGYDIRVPVTMDSLAAGEARDYVADNIKITVSATERLTLNVRPTGAEFADGSHWAAPRTRSSPLGRRCLDQPKSMMRLRNCECESGTYKVTGDLIDRNIVAYRLGIVKDTPDQFEVSFGKWIEVRKVRGEKEGGIVDSGQSLGNNAAWSSILKGESTKSGQSEITAQVGVAIFVAELRFADGRVWSQDIKREALLWNN